jgi:hypothetical protein
VRFLMHVFVWVVRLQINVQFESPMARARQLAGPQSPHSLSGDQIKVASGSRLRPESMR